MLASSHSEKARSPPLLSFTLRGQQEEAEWETYKKLTHKETVGEGGSPLPWESWELTAYLQPNQPPAALFMSPLTWGSSHSIWQQSLRKWEETVVKIGSALKHGFSMLNNYHHMGLVKRVFIHSCQDRVCLPGDLGITLGLCNAWPVAVCPAEESPLAVVGEAWRPQSPEVRAI